MTNFNAIAASPTAIASLSGSDIIVIGDPDNPVTNKATTLALLAGRLATLAGVTIASGAGIGFTAGVGAVYKSGIEYIGDIIKTTIVIDLTGLASSTTDLDVIGIAGGGCHIGQITTAQNGIIDAVRMTCLELPAGGADDIILYSADESTLAFDSAISAATGETVIIDPAAAWANGTVKGATTVPGPGQYLYLVNGEAGTAATYTAGKFVIELYGHAA